MIGGPRCPECGTAWSPGDTGRDCFHLLGVWEGENPAVILQAHHLMVLCYHLQHPSLYSPRG